MREGRRIDPRPSIEEDRARTLASLERLPERFQALHDGPHYPVAHSAALDRLLEGVRRHFSVSPEIMNSARVPTDAAAQATPVFLDVDTQVDFMLPTGALYVPAAESITPNIKKLITFAQENRIPILSTADAHPPDDPSSAQWPPHCVVGTGGQQRIPETRLDSPCIIPNTAGAFAPPHEWSGQFIIEKTDYDVSTNPNFENILSALSSALGPVRFILFGVATEFCVRAAALALRKHNLPVDVVVDAIKAITEEGGRHAIDEMAGAGVRLVTTAEVRSTVNIAAAR
jgi:nicotinamidase/pyrazinamidase